MCKLLCLFFSLHRLTSTRPPLLHTFVHRFKFSVCFHFFFLSFSFLLFYVYVYGDGWYLKGGRELPDDIRQKVQSDGSLVISPVQKQDDSGVYTCWARNKQGHSARRSGEVAVIGK